MYSLCMLRLDVSGCFLHSVGVESRDLVRLGQYVMSRRVALGHKHRVALANVLSITDRTLADIENGVREASGGTYALLENKLGWKPGSVTAILGGGEPTEVAEAESFADASTGDIFAGIYDLVGELKRRMDSRSVIADKPKNLPNWGRGVRPRPPGDDSRVSGDQ